MVSHHAEKTPKTGEGGAMIKKLDKSLYRVFLLLLLGGPFLNNLYGQDPYGEESVDTVLSNVTNYEDSSNEFERVTDTSAILTRSVPDSIRRRILSDKDYWYVSTAPDRQKNKAADPQGEPWYDKKWFQQLLWIVAVVSFVVILLWFLSASNIKLFRKKPASVANEEEVGLTEEDLFHIPYEEEIKKAVQAENYRLATRLWYLRTLKELASLDLIHYSHGRTNSEYVQQLQSTSYYNDFFRLTRSFEYIWYGKFSPSAERYPVLEKQFMDFKNRLQG